MIKQIVRIQQSVPLARRVPGLLHECEICNKWEKSMKLLKTHQFKTHRVNKYRYLCPVCQDSFTRPGSVRQHLSRAHGVPRSDQGAIHRIQMRTPFSRGYHVLES